MKCNNCENVLTDNETVCPICETAVPIPAPSDVEIMIQSSNAPQAESIHYANEIPNHAISIQQTPKKKTGLIIAIVAALIVIILAATAAGVLFLSTKNLMEIENLPGIGSVQLNGAYVMSVPSYSYRSFMSNYDMDNTKYLCLSLHVKNTQAKTIDLNELVASNVRAQEQVIGTKTYLLGETGTIDSIKIKSGDMQDILIAFSVPEDTEIKDIELNLRIARHNYVYTGEYVDVRQFVANLNVQGGKAMEIRLEFLSKLVDSANAASNAENYSGRAGFEYALKFCDNFYDNYKDIPGKSRQIIAAIEMLEAPNIPFYRQCKTDLIADVQEIIDVLAPLSEFSYPTNDDTGTSNLALIEHVLQNYIEFSATNLTAPWSHTPVNDGAQDRMSNTLDNLLEIYEKRILS